MNTIGSRVDILRTYLGQETLSTLNVIDDYDLIIFQCKGLEPPDRQNQKKISCILEDTYWVTFEESSPHHEYPHFRVEDKHGREGVLWHGGNYYFDTEACYLPGDSFGDRNKDGVLDVLNSRETLKKLIAILPKRFQATYKKKL